MSLAPIAVGAAVVTTAGRLWAKYIIHAPTMEEPGTKVGVENARRAARAALIAAALRGFDVIAIPGLAPAWAASTSPKRPRHGRRVAGPSTTQANHRVPGGHQRRHSGLSGRALRSATS